jgi:predicted metal-dependent phosphoesterase TrpH
MFKIRKKIVSIGKNGREDYLMGLANKCDLHIHSNFSDGSLSVPEIVDLYGKKGYGTIAITDHLCEHIGIVGRVSHGLKYTLNQDNFANYMATLRYEAERAWNKYRMRLIPGYEITKNSFVNHRSAHILVLGTEEYIAPEQSVDEILVQAKKKGAFTIAAHPFDTGSRFEFQTFHLWSRRHELSHLVDAWEMNSRKDVSSDVMRSGLPLIANSDMHIESNFASWKTEVFADRDQESVFAAIRSQKIDFFVEN